MKARQNQFEFPRIGIDIPNRKNTAFTGLELLRINGNEILMQVELLVGDGPKFHRKTKER